MKITDIVIKEKCIILGVFGTIAFNVASKIPNVLSYIHFEELIEIDYNQRYKHGIVIEKVLQAAILAEQIIFILDDVKFPIDPSNSVTCGELQLVCENPHLFNKCVFVKGDNVIEFDKNLVLNS